MYKRNETMKITSSSGICKTMYDNSCCLFLLGKRTPKSFQVPFK